MVEVVSTTYETMPRPSVWLTFITASRSMVARAVQLAGSATWTLSIQLGSHTGEVIRMAGILWQTGVSPLCAQRAMSGAPRNPLSSSQNLQKTVAFAEPTFCAARGHDERSIVTDCLDNKSKYTSMFGSAIDHLSNAGSATRQASLRDLAWTMLEVWTLPGGRQAARLANSWLGTQGWRIQVLPRCKIEKRTG